jgi:RNA-binding protein
VTPELTENVREALIARELIKIGILQNCMDDPKEMAQTLAERTKSQVVQIIGKKIVLYKEGQGDDRKIVLPK